MSSKQNQKQKKNRKAFSKTLKAQIKTVPHSQPIDGVQYIYGLLQKKSQSSLFNNQRFLIIKGHQTFGYVSKLSDETLLPFIQTKNIPKCKTEVPLQKLKISNEKQILIVEFQQQDKKQKTRWEFKCSSKVKAIEWRQLIEGAKNQKILRENNKPLKVILEDPNEKQSQSQAKQMKRIELINSDLKSGQNKEENVNGASNPFKQPVQSKNLQQNIIIKDDNLQEQQRINQTVKQEINNQLQKQKTSTSKQQKFPEVNIFESLLYSSPVQQQRYPSKASFDQQRQKSFEGLQLKEKSQIYNKNQQKYTEQDSLTPNKAKQQFLRRKKEESQIKQELKQQGSNNMFLGSILKTLADNKYQIEKLKKEWGYEFAKGLNEYEIVQHYKAYAEIITVKIIDQLALEPKKRYYKPVSENSESLKYEIDGVSFEFFFHELKQVSSFQKNGSIISNKRTKRAYQELKNYDYILHLTNNKGRIRVPLAMCVQYKGFVCLTKAIVPEGESYSNEQSLQKELDLLQAESRISTSIFEDGENGRIIPLLSKVYEKIARSQNSFANGSSKRFDICYVQGLKHYLPQDFYRYNLQNNKGSQSSINSTQILRKQLIQDQQYDETVFYGQNMTNVIHRLKMPQYLKQGIDTLSEVSKSISDRINALVLALENLDQFVTNSRDLSILMHGYGVNMRYLGLLLQRSHQSWLKSVIVSEVAARCAKLFLQFDLQDCIMNLNQSKAQNIRRYQVKQVITFFNKLLGNSQESDLFWNQLSRQAQQNFQCYIDKKSLNVGYFIQSLQYQCRIQLVNVFQKKQDFFKVPEPLNVDNFCSFGLNSKTYDLSFTQLYKTVSHHLKQITQQSFEQLSILLNLPRKGSLPSHFRLNHFDQKIILFMINWLSPFQGRHIYYPEEIKFGQILPTKTLYQIKLTEIKWLLKQKKQAQAQKVRDWLVQHVNRWLGQYHPILSELYDLFSRYYATFKLQEKKAITYCKSSVKNIQKLLGQSNIKLADNYYMLAEIYINYQKKTEALSSLRRAKQILQEREGQQTEAYGIIELRMGQLLLANNMVKEGLNEAVKAYTRLIEGEDLQKLVQCLELVGRCYELTQMWMEYVRFTQQIMNNTNKLQQLSENATLLERGLKVLVLPYFSEIARNAQTSKQLLTALSSFPSLSNITSSAQNSSYAYIKSLILSSNKTFPQQFISILGTDLQQLLEEVESSGIMTRWKGFQNLILNKSLVQKINSISALNAKAYQFLVVLQALAVFLGQGWIEGVLRN